MPVFPSAIADCIDYDVLIYIDVVMKRRLRLVCCLHIVLIWLSRPRVIGIVI